MIYSSGQDDAKHKVLVVFKFWSPWNIHIVEKLSQNFKLYFCFYIQLAQEIADEKLIVSYFLNAYSHLSVSAIILDSGFFPQLQKRFCQTISRMGCKVGHLLFDDGPMFLQNIESMPYSDFVLTACPLSMLKYREIGLEASFFPLTCESLVNRFGDRSNLDKLYDLCFVGHGSKCDRPELLNMLTGLNKLRLRIHDRSAHGDLPDEQMYKIRFNSLYTLSPSKSEYEVYGVDQPKHIRYVRQLKGHVEEALFCGSAVIAEESVALDLIDPQKTILRFSSVSELRHIVSDLTMNLHNYFKYSSAQFNALYDKYCDATVNKNLEELLERL